ncbi:hypothetical protein JCM13664_08700 [Methylothermus subterraneus]
MDEDGFEALEVFPGFAVALDIGAQAEQAADDRLGLGDGGHHAGVETLDLLDQHGVQEGLVLAAAQTQGLLSSGGRYSQPASTA